MTFAAHLAKVREKSPLVLCLTNFVTVTECANALLAIGASPVMSLSKDDAAELASMASALVLNIGTIDPGFLETMLAAAQAANAREIPVLLDPVGAGATAERLRASRRILEEARPSIVRGNASEIRALLDIGGPKQKGVDAASPEEGSHAEKDAHSLAVALNTVVAVTGKTDHATDGRKSLSVEGGSELLTKLTGTGCMLSAMMAAFVAANPQEPLDAAGSALALLKKAGERAESGLTRALALGEFKSRLFDNLAIA